MPDIDREQVLAYRIAVHGLHRETTDPAALAVFDLGVQDSTRGGTADLALAARLRAPEGARDGWPGTGSLAADDRFTLAWSYRGAPHYHRAAEFPGLIPALLPLDDADARARLSWRRADLAAAGMSATEALRTAARALRTAVPAPMTKAAASTAVTKLVPAGLSGWCGSCRATHIHDQMMRLAAPLAGLRLEPGYSPVTLAPVERRGRVPARTDVVAATRLVRHYLRLHGPALPADAAGFLGTTRATVAGALWPGDVAEVRVEGSTRFLPADALAALENPPEPGLVRLLPPGDPFLQARDRALLVPEKARHKEIWKVLGNPGVIVADGAVTGVWRTRSSGRRLDVTLTKLLPMPKRTRSAAEDEVERVRAVRGFDALRVTWS